MRNPPVHWHEGLFLRPHHFQVADRHWDERLATAHAWDNPYRYGLYAFEFSREALANNQFEVYSLKARLRDGTLVDLDAGRQPDRVDLREAMREHGQVLDLAESFESERVVRVYLALPKLQVGRPNVGDEEDEAGATRRFSESHLPVQDESYGGNEQEVRVRHLNARLMLSTQDLSGYEILPIAQLKRAGDEGVRPQLDDEYFPPIADLEAWPPLGKSIVRAIHDMIGQKIEVLAEQMTSRGVGFDSRHPGDLDRLLLLNELNGANAALQVLAFARGVHPYDAYVELCRTLGRLAVFSPERRLEELPNYDHEDLARIFRLVHLRFDRLLNTVRDYEFEQRFFVGVGMGLQVTLEPKWFNADWEWYIGVRKGDLSTAECMQLLSPGRLDWKFGSAQQVEILFKHRSEGLQLQLVERAVRALPAGDDWLFYQVSRSDHPAWRDVQQTQTLAVRLRDSLILNQDRLQGERDLVVSVNGRPTPLQFALFAVPTRA
jgi:type VI secretion system protein ImpJ